MSHSSKYICKHCSKEYNTSQSRSNHYRLYHKISVTQNVTIPLKNVIQKSPNIDINEDVDKFHCSKCNKQFKFRQGKWRHEQKCDKNDIIKMKEEMKELKNIVNKLTKKTTNKSIINIGTVNAVNGNVVNNINALGYENIQKKLSEKEKINLITGMRVKEHPIIELVRKIYTDDKFKEDRNTLITNLRAKDCLVYNSDTNKFDATTKNDHIDNIIENRKHNIVSIYNELSANNKLRPVEIKAIDIYLNEIEDLGKKNPKVKELYEKHKAEIIYIIYNSKEFMSMLKNNLEDNTIEL
jgi:hypothetical protein